MRTIMEEAIKKTIEVKTLKEVDINKIDILIIAIYEKPLDYPEHYVARFFEGVNPTNIILKKEKLEEVRKDIIESFPHLVRFDRGAEDPKSLIEVWL